MKHALTTFTAALALASCASTDKAPIVPPKKWETTATEAIKRRLRDPYTAKVSVEEPKLGGFWQNYRYFSFARVNAKNAFGGYTGEKEKVVIYNGDKVASVNDSARQIALDSL